MSTCPTAMLEGAAVMALLAGVSIKIIISNLTRPEFFQLRRNSTVFLTILIGNLACIIYFAGAIRNSIYGPSLNVARMAFNARSIAGLCLLLCLTERATAISAFGNISPKARIALKYVIALILWIPDAILSFIVLVYGSITGGPLLPVLLASAAALTYVTLFAYCALTFLFMHRLAQNRPGSIFQLFKTHPRLWAEILFDLFVGVFLIITRSAEYSLSIPIVLFSYFNSSCYVVVILTGFKNFITVTTKFTKEILQTTVNVSTVQKGNGQKQPEKSVLPQHSANTY